MVLKLLRGKEVADGIKNQISDEIVELNKEGKIPLLGIVRLGDDPSDISYEKSIVKNCDSLGIKTRVEVLDRQIDTNGLLIKIDELNRDELVSGILVFRPLPNHIDEDKVRKHLDPMKDVDCMHPLNLEKIFKGDSAGFAPCTPKAAMEILAHYKISLEGKKVVVINRSMVVGKPLAMMLLEKNATVTICHSRTKNLADITKKADIVVTGLGKAKFFGDKYFNKDSVVIDVGVSLDEEGKYSGDVDIDKVRDMVSMITPVPGGVGSVTTSILLKQVVEASKLS